jgi:cardiolipin synthase (CMP-forming)
MEKNLNLPNLISGCRLAAVPLLVYFIITGNAEAFKWILLFSLLSDIADGWIARTFKMTTKLGSTLDAMADTALYFVVIAAIFRFQAVFLRANWLLCGILLALYIAEKIKCMVKFGRPFNSFHNYSAKVMGYAQGIFIISLFFFGFKWYTFYPAIAAGVIANIEDMIMTSMFDTYEHDTKGLYWVLKNRI